MTKFWFEHWVSGRIEDIRICSAHSTKEAVILLSELYPKGVFLLKDKQTEQQRIKENWRRFEQVSGDV